MAISYVQSFPPKWFLVNNEGQAAGGAQLFTYDNLTREPKPIYQDAAGLVPWSNPLIFDLNGTKGPIYWKLDDANPDDLYYVEAYDSDGNLLWSEDDFPSAGGGGGSNVTTFLPLRNYIANNQFVNVQIPISSPLPTNLVIAPSNHRGFTPAAIPVIGTFGALGPNIRFVKNNTNATDAIIFTGFPLGSNILTDDVTPVRYLRYQCTNSPAGETYKSFQFPITQKVQNLSNQAMTLTIWAAVDSTPVDIKIYTRQYFGSGTGASPEVRTQIGTCSLTTTWTKFTINFTMPSVAGKTLGTPGLTTNDDAVYIHVEMPLGAPCDVFFTKPCLYLGTLSPQADYETNDQIDSIDQTPRTGDVKLSYLAGAPLGWTDMDDGTIGNQGSGATNIAGERAFQLYKTLWDTVSDTWAPVSGGRGATATADFLAGKVMTLPRILGRALASSGAGSGLTSRALGEFTGTETVGFTILAANLPPHTHTYTYTDQGVGSGFGFASGTNKTVTANVTGAGPGVSSPISLPNMEPTSFMHVFIKL